LLTLEDVVTFYGNVRALKGVSLTVPDGSIVALLGANGAGKTTTLRSIAKLTQPSAGAITFDGRRIEKLSPDKVVSLGISLVPQGRLLFSELTVAENLELGAYLRNDTAQIRRDVDKAFNLFPILRERRGQEAGTLSGGQQQMLAIARALMSRPKLLMLDEPSLGLAPIVVAEIFETIRRIRADGMAILLVEQNANMALNAADYGYVLENGRIVMEDSCERLREKDDIKEFYLGLKDEGVRGERRWI